MQAEFLGRLLPYHLVVAGHALHVVANIALCGPLCQEVPNDRSQVLGIFAGHETHLLPTFRDASAPQAVLTESAGDPSIAPDARPVYDAKNHSLVLFDRGDEIVVQAGPEGIRFLLVSGKPLEEPVAWYGPIVMNTQAELRQAMSELQDGTFIHHK